MSAPNNEDEKNTSSSETKGGNITFPMKLHILLDRVEESDGNLTDIISWLPDGRSFKVHQKEAFSNGILPEFFSTNKYKSFQRSLNLWGFETVPKGPEKGVCSHPLFIRGKAELCRQMKRVIIKGTGTTRKQAPPPAVPEGNKSSSDLALVEGIMRASSLLQQNRDSSVGLTSRDISFTSKEFGQMQPYSSLETSSLVASLVRVSQLQSLMRQKEEEEAVKKMLARQQILRDKVTFAQLAAIQILTGGLSG